MLTAASCKMPVNRRLGIPMLPFMVHIHLPLSEMTFVSFTSLSLQKELKVLYS